MPEEIVICSGFVERIGEKRAHIKHNSSSYSFGEQIAVSNHKEALEYIVGILVDEKNGAISSINEVEAVGHRVVHGGQAFKDTIEINETVKSQIEELFDLAPLHNPSNLEGVKVAESIFTSAKQAAVFDTAFHQSIPAKAFTYAIPKEITEKHNVRLYGFHGTSHKYVSEEAINYLGEGVNKIITIHLGNGCSISAVKNGKCIDHSLGFSPVNGLIMGTRSGDIDHSLIFYLVNTLGYELDDVNSLLQKKSGLLGLTGYNDLRDIQTEAAKGDKACQLALDMKVYRIKKYIGSYVAAMNGLDCLVFTAGIGENSELIRDMVCNNMDTFGISIDKSNNQKRTSGILDISGTNSKVKLLVVPTNEELEIARQTFFLFQGKDK